MSHRRKAMWCLLAIASGAVSGCVGPIYSPDTANAPAAAISPRHKWRITGDLRDVQKAIDGDVLTAAVSEKMSNGESLTLDLGKPCLFNFITIDHGPEEMGFCRSMVLMTSMDGRMFDYRLAVSGTRRVTSLCTLTPILARYVRLQSMVPGDRPWTVAEIYVQ